MKTVRTLFAGLLLFSFSCLHAQSADEIIDKHIAAIGGKDVLKKITSQVVYSNLSVMGSDLASTSTLVVGKAFKNVANFNGQEIIQCITPTSGWMINPLQGQTDPQALPEDQVKAAQSALEIGGGLFNYKQKGSRAELTGTEKIEDVNAIKVKLTDKDSKASFYFFDPATYYLIKHEVTTNSNGQDITMTSLFSNYKKTDIGFVVPFTTVRNQGFEMTITVNKVEFNKAIDLKIFEMPK